MVNPLTVGIHRVDEDGVVADKKYRIKDTETKEFWLPILKQKSFQDYIKNKYQIASGSIMQEDIDGAFELETSNGVEDD
jgi:hypothetical protein